MKSGALHFPTIEEMVMPFERRGFSAEVLPLWSRTPFNSHLIILRAPDAARQVNVIENSAGTPLRNRG